jgi:hypothetical protein
VGRLRHVIERVAEVSKFHLAQPSRRRQQYCIW